MAQDHVYRAAVAPLERGLVLSFAWAFCNEFSLTVLAGPLVESNAFLLLTSYNSKGAVYMVGEVPCKS